MSVVITFSQIEKQNVISENKIFGLYEIPLEKIAWKNECFLNVDIFQNLQDDANKWGEVYHQPNKSKFLFYLVAVDTEMEIGIRTEEEIDIITAFDPKTINEFVNPAKALTDYGEEGVFDELSALLEEAINNNLIIVTRIS
ncbi:MAG: hypothetical protein AB8G15_18415 [Saprospiraceae bacterium]